ncbi:MAG TPA: type II secretion system protein [Candidatus Woesebacteria bacterium]|nr:type II secretion system protein [Candidatus Woesebacteria bacterium]
MHSKGFSLIEIIVVIALIALLATIGLSTYDRVQKNARDARRIADIEEIRKALLVYKSLNGTFPLSSGADFDNDCSGWDTSFDEDFIKSLNNPSYIESMPRDPLNEGSVACDGHANDGFNYLYHRYNAGEYGCQPNRPFVVLGAGTMETSNGAHPKSQKLECPGGGGQSARDWHQTLDYFIVMYE